MLVLRPGPKGARVASFGIGLCVFALMPTETGYQDIASQLARQPGVAERWQKRVFSAAASVQVATYSFGLPIGTSTPQGGIRLASLSGRGLDITGSTTPRNPALQVPPRYQSSDFPKVDRTLKGDRLVVRPPTPAPSSETAEPVEAAPTEPAPSAPVTPDSNSSVFGAKTSEAPTEAPAPRAALDPELQEALSAPPLSQYDASKPDARPSGELKPATDAPTDSASGVDGLNIKTANLYFGTTSLGGVAGSMETWQPGEAPLIVMPDPDLKPMAALSQPAEDLAKDLTKDLTKSGDGGESIAPKGEVNTDNQRARTPAERLGLTDDKARFKSEKCLAEAVYFESRGEAVRGQIAVAQVVLNRAFSGYYPTTVCGVVYQNKYRHFACQFTFACDNVADVVREPEMWDRAKKIAKAMLDGLIWLPEVGKSTHYHAYWVRPSWVAEMKRMYKFGVHTFYRPKRWGDGSDAPSWGTPQQTAAISAELTEAAKSEAEINPNWTRR
ncbi:Putative hydrolase [Bradyrhizobium sp. ORS 285]|uniref:cell wall hydrolase n=1 Tax=Bradyrhizobium sp. ORS 285 TaxID=115808 RepID=UPI0002FA28F0|nr:cell wall hydrolase [Bradyrhizobium sp. ORS 285]SMX60070.1 Putative hydrolase [Bradyrhizobium sp. ORS 285]